MSEVNVRKRGQKWQYQFEAAKIEGKRKQITKSGFRTKKEALEAGVKALAEYNNSGTYFEPTEMSVADYLDYWFTNYVSLELKYTTQNNYKNHIENHIKPTLGKYKLKSLSPAIMQDFINSEFTAGFGKGSLKGLMGVLSGSLKYAVHPCGFIKINPMQYVKLPKYDSTKENKSIRFITQKEYKNIIERFPEDSDFYIPIVIGYHAGLRIGETFALTWEDIDLDNQTIDINKTIYYNETSKSWYFGTTKTYTSNRKIKIGNTLLNILKKHKKKQIQNQLYYGAYYRKTYEGIEKSGNKILRPLYSFPNNVSITDLKSLNMICTRVNGEFMTPNSFKYAAKVIHYELHIKNFCYHALRHTHATILIENGAEIKDVQVRLGHADIETTYNSYVHHTNKMANNSIDIFEKAVNSNKSS